MNVHEQMTAANGAEEKTTYRNTAKDCLHCRFFDGSRGTDLAVCRRHKIRTHTGANCGEYDGKACAS